MTKHDYRFKRFTPKLLLNDLLFNKPYLNPGDQLPDFELQTTEGKTVTQAGYLADRSLLLFNGSINWRMTASAIPSLKQLHAEYGDSVNFLLLNIPEAHPGKAYPNRTSTMQSCSMPRPSPLDTLCLGTWRFIVWTESSSRPWQHTELGSIGGFQRCNRVPCPLVC